MKYRDLHIHTQREAPNNARTAGFAWLVRAGYMTRENQFQPLGEQALSRLRDAAANPTFMNDLGLPTVSNDQETYFPIVTGAITIVHCDTCGYTARKETAQSRKPIVGIETPRSLEKVPTPDCNTIESLAEYLKIPRDKTAKALMFKRISDARFVFVVIRGDMTLSEAKLRNVIGDFRLATSEEISGAGACAGYASAIGLNTALIVVDDIIPKSPNLVAGANEIGFHLLNTNCGRDYTPEIVADLILAGEDDPCISCGNPLREFSASLLTAHSVFNFENILLALAETHHDDKGLVFPPSTAPFDVHLLHLPGRELDTHTNAEQMYNSLLENDISVLFDDREERAGVKFNDADLIGCPIRITVGEKALQKGMVELKPRNEKDHRLVPIGSLAEELKKE